MHSVLQARPRRGSNRRFEILLCPPGERAELVSEPGNPVDPQAVAVYSVSGVQIGYLTAERAPWIASMIKNGPEVRVIFQAATITGTAIRVGLDGEEPVLLPPTVAKPVQADRDRFWPDEIPSDD